MEAPIVGSLLTVTTNAVLKAIEFGWTAHRGNRTNKAEYEAELKAREKLALHYWGCLLWELRSSCERLRYMSEQAPAGGTSFGFFDFTVSDAVMPDFCRVVPSPRLLASFQSILAAVKRVDFFQRAAARDEAVPASKATLGGAAMATYSAYDKGKGFATDAMNKGVVGRFNELVRLGHEVGKAAYDDCWAGDGSNLFPMEIDATKPIDHSLL
jgi:hypothetical protein